jgi:hypothetical protein
MAKKPTLPPATLGKPSKKAKYSPTEDESEEECDECGEDHGGSGITLKISLLLPENMQPRK